MTRLRRLQLAGLLGSVLLVAGGAVRGALPRPAPGSWFGTGELAEHAGVRTAGTLAVAVGAAVLCAAWWRVRPLLAVRDAAVTATLWSLPLVVGPPLFSRDVYAYGGQAVVVARGFDPYVLGPIEGGGALSAHVDEVWRGTPSPYGPAYLAPASWLVRLVDARVVPTVLLLRLLAVLGVVLAGVALVHLARRCGTPPERALWLGVLNPLVLLHGISGAHNDVLMAGLVLAGLAVGLGGGGRRLVAAGALVALGALVKAPAVAALPVLVLAAPALQARVRAAALVGAGALAVGAGLPLATGLGFGWLSTIDTGRRLLSLFSPATGLGTLLGEAASLVGAGSVDGVRSAVLDAAPLVAVLAGGALLLLTPRLGPVAALGWALVAVVLLSPTVLPWYAVWGVLPLAAVAGARAATGLAAASVLLSLATWPDGRSLVRPPLFGLQVALAVLLAVAVARRRRPVPESAP